MRGKEANAGSLRVLLLILALLVANLIAGNLRHPGRGAAESKDRAASLGSNLRAQELASDPQRFVDGRGDPSAALGMTEERKP